MIVNKFNFSDYANELIKALDLVDQKQIDIFYRTGRPIFTIDKHKMEFFAKF